MKNTIVLCILDGWGYRQETADNAINMGHTPTWDYLISHCPTTMLNTSGKYVGLPDNQMGNSEVGHTNIGAGRIVMQDLPKIDAAIKNDELKNNAAIVDLINKVKSTNGTCHLLGLVGNGGVHAQQRHLLALVDILNAHKIPTALHCFMDGRDTPPDSGESFIAEIESHIADMKNTYIATISGRYYAMDRDNRWDRVMLAYNAMVSATGPRFNTASEAIAASYQEKVLDEFIIPCVIGNYQGMDDNDAFMMANYRSDRAREITRMLAEPDFDLAPREKTIQFSDKVAMTEYSAQHNQWLNVAFPPEKLNNILGQVIADNGMTQLRIAETEKYAHVTFFFNGGQEELFNHEERILIPSPKVATYDLQPEMSAYELTDKLVEAINSRHFDLIVVNYANGDMVGHTGVLSAAIQAVEAVDSCLDRVVQAIKAQKGMLFITADHGNAELMKNPETGAPFTAHTNTPVQGVLFNAPNDIIGLQNGSLCDIAPMILDLLHIKQPSEMTGQSLLIKKVEK